MRGSRGVKEIVARPVTAPGRGTMASRQLTPRRSSTAYQKKLGPFRILGVDSKLAETNLVDWAHEHETDVNVQQCEIESRRTVANLRVQFGSLLHTVQERTELCVKLKEELEELNHRQVHLENVKEQWSKFMMQKQPRAERLIMKREYGNRNDQTPSGCTDEPGKFWSLRTVDPGSRADPALAEQVAQLEEDEIGTLYNVASIEIDGKGYDMVVKRLIDFLEVANVKLLALQNLRKRADEELRTAEKSCLDIKRSAEHARLDCEKFERAQHSRRLLRKNALQTKKLEQTRSQEEWQKMEETLKKLEEKEARHRKTLKANALKMNSTVLLQRAAIEGYDKRLEYSRFEQLRTVTKGSFPAEVVHTYLTEYGKRQQAKHAITHAEEELKVLQIRKKEMDKALHDRMAGTSLAENKELNEKQDTLTHSLNAANEKIQERRRKSMDMSLKIVNASQGLCAMMQKICLETTACGNVYDTSISEVKSAVEVEDLLRKFDYILDQSSLLDIANQPASTTLVKRPGRSDLFTPSHAVRGQHVHADFSSKDTSDESSSDSEKE